MSGKDWGLPLHFWVSSQLVWGNKFSCPFCHLSLCVPSFSLPWRGVLVNPFDLVLWLYHLIFLFMVRQSSYELIWLYHWWFGLQTSPEIVFWKISHNPPVVIHLLYKIYIILFCLFFHLSLTFFFFCRFFSACWCDLHHMCWCWWSSTVQVPIPDSLDWRIHSSHWARVYGASDPWLQTGQ